MMGNPMMQQLNQGKMQSLLGNISNIRKSVDALKSLGSPETALQHLMQGSPQMKQALDYVNEHGGNPKEVCFNLLKENGLDPQAIENEITK